jgi:dTDP-glucose 4,6-dehydratase
VHGDITQARGRRARLRGQAGGKRSRRALRGREPRRPLDPVGPAVRADERVGTQVLLDAARRHGVERFVHVSTDEVYGSLGATGSFREDTPLAPNSPYSASKAGSRPARARRVHTHGFPRASRAARTTTGPTSSREVPAADDRQRERGQADPGLRRRLYVRDWLYVRDHCEAILAVLEKGRPGEVYNIGGNNELANLDLVKRVLRELASREPDHLRQGPPGPRPALRDRRHEDQDQLGWTPRFA